jgi:hypothetical protein
MSDEIEDVQAAVAAAINTLGETLIGSGFAPPGSSPIPDAEVANMLANAKCDCHACELGDPAMCYGCPVHGAWCDWFGEGPNC